MTKLEFLATLEKALAGLPKEDCKRIVDYYCEMIDDRMEDGFSEEDAVKAAGTLEEIAQQAAQEAPQERPRRKMRTAHALSGWEITLLVLGAPLWLPLLATFAALVLTVVAVMASVLATAYAVASTEAMTATTVSTSAAKVASSGSHSGAPRTSRVISQPDKACAVRIFRRGRSCGASCAAC